MPVSEILCIVLWRGCLSFQQPSLSPRQVEFLLNFTARCSSSWHWWFGRGGFPWGWDTTFLMGYLSSWDVPLDSQLLHLGSGPAHFVPPLPYQSPCGFFRRSLIIRLLFSCSSDGYSCWLFYNLVVILMWSWEKVSATSTFFAILGRYSEIYLET